MKLHALLCFYDEPVETIDGYLAGLHRADVDHLIVVDGAYALYPHGKPSSSPSQHTAIEHGCRELGIALTVHRPAATWAGNEVEKRTFLFTLADCLSDPEDWFLVLDTDEWVHETGGDLKERLAVAEFDIGRVVVVDDERMVDNRLFRAQPIEASLCHNRWVTSTGRRLRNGLDERSIPGVVVFDGFVVHHHPETRSRARRIAKARYYELRDEAGVERAGHQVAVAA